jgi:hypothetical protein
MKMEKFFDGIGYLLVAGAIFAVFWVALTRMTAVGFGGV